MRNCQKNCVLVMCVITSSSRCGTRHWRHQVSLAFQDENFGIAHDAGFLLSMANAGVVPSVLSHAAFRLSLKLFALTQSPNIAVKAGR